jgi:uncharacterized protein YfaT (DUF1175 family)
LTKNKAVVVVADLVAMVHLDRKDRRDRRVSLVQMANKALRVNPEKWVQRDQSDLRANKVFRAFRVSKVSRASLDPKAIRARSDLKVR